MAAQMAGIAGCVSRRRGHARGRRSAAPPRHRQLSGIARRDRQTARARAERNRCRRRRQPFRSDRLCRLSSATGSRARGYGLENDGCRTRSVSPGPRPNRSWRAHAIAHAHRHGSVAVGCISGGVAQSRVRTSLDRRRSGARARSGRRRRLPRLPRSRKARRIAKPRRRSIGLPRDRGCLAANAPAAVPHYSLTAGQRSALNAFIDWYRAHPDVSPAPVYELRVRMRQLRCAACHEVDAAPPVPAPSRKRRRRSPMPEPGCERRGCSA